MTTSTANSTYTLTQADMNAFNALIAAQGNIGPAQSSVGQTQLWNFFGAIRSIAYDQVRFVQNAQLKTWLQLALDILGKTSTNYTIGGKNLTGAGMFVLYMYHEFNDECMQGDVGVPSCGQTGYPPGFLGRNGGTWLTGCTPDLQNATPWNWFGPGLFQAPNTYQPFYNSMNTDANLLQQDLVEKKNSTQTVAIAYPGTANTFAQIQAFQKSRFDTSNWTNSATLASAFNSSSIISDQAAMLRSMITSSTLDSSNYVFLLYLLIAMSMSSTSNQEMANTILSTVTNSMEYPNETFCNTLLYFVLMELADPLGDFGFDHATLINVFTGLEADIVITTPSSNTITTGLARQLKILKVDTSYPMQDPYTNVPFNTRKSDIIEALDTARGTMSLKQE